MTIFPIKMAHVPSFSHSFPIKMAIFPWASRKLPLAPGRLPWWPSPMAVAFSVTESGVAPASTIDMHTDKDSGDTTTFLGGEALERRFSGTLDGDKTRNHGDMICNCMRIFRNNIIHIDVLILNYMFMHYYYHFAGRTVDN